jgi:hypothetical protein
VREILFPLHQPITLDVATAVVDSERSIILLPFLGPLGWFDDRSLGSISFGVLVLALPPSVLHPRKVEEKMQIPPPLPRDRNASFIFSKPARGSRAYAMQFRKTERSSAAESLRLKRRR